MMEHKGSAVDKGTAEAVNVGNTICPVSGEDIESMGGGVQEEYNGKIYNFCCASCAKVFKKDPEKYSRIAEESAEESTEESMEGEHTGSHHAH
ncbi:MAG: YHS domain-containing protein [Candidatus Omnitrophota bacterium]